MTAKTEKVLKKLITMSRKLKAQGHDLFVSFSPHVDKVQWDLHVGGWKEDVIPTFTQSIYSIQETKDNPQNLISSLYECLEKSNIKIGK